MCPIYYYHELLDSFNQSSQCSQHVITCFRPPRPQCLCSVGPPLYLHIIHLKERISKQSTCSESLLYPVFQLHNTGKGAEVHSSQVLDGLGHLVDPLVQTSPIQDPHPEQVEEDWIIDMSLINLSEPFGPLDHVGPKTIVKEEVWVHVPLPLVMNDGLIIQLTRLHNPMEGILGYL